METLLVETRASSSSSSSSSSRWRTALVLACALCGLILGCVPAALRRRDAPRLQAWEFAELPLDGRWDAITDLWERPLCAAMNRSWDGLRSYEQERVRAALGSDGVFALR